MPSSRKSKLALLALNSCIAFSQVGIGQYPVNLTVSGPPTSSGSGVISGCGVEWISGLIFEVGICNYSIRGTAYTSPLTQITLTTADVTNPRIDVIGVNDSGVVFSTAGTPAASPAQPTIDQSTQLQLTFVTIAAGATTPFGISLVDIYSENTEWTSAVTANINAASTTNPYRGTKDIEATAAVLNNNFTLTKPAAGTVDIGLYNNLTFYIRSKATWPTGNSGANAARTIAISWLNGSTQRGLQVILRSGVFGFDSSNTAAYQQVSIPTSLFNANGLLVTTLKFNISGNSGSSTIGFYVDAVSLQTGVTSFTVPTNQRLTSRGIDLDGAGDVIATGVKGDIALDYSGTIVGWTLVAPTEASCTATIDLWKDTYANYKPTVADTITGSEKPLLSAAAKNQDLTPFNGGTTIFSAGDIIRVNLDSNTDCTRLILTLRLLKSE